MGDQKSSAGLLLRPCATQQDTLLQSTTATIFSLDESYLSARLTIMEMEEAIKSMRGHSSPGMDRLPAAFYQLTPSVFGECLQIVFEQQLRRGSLLRSHRSPAMYKSDLSVTLRILKNTSNLECICVKLLCTTL